MTRLVRAEFRKLLSTRLWCWMLLAAAGQFGQRSVSHEPAVAHDHHVVGKLFDFAERVA